MKKFLGFVLALTVLILIIVWLAQGSADAPVPQPTTASYTDCWTNLPASRFGCGFEN